MVRLAVAIVFAAGCDDHLFNSPEVEVTGTIDASWAGMEVFFEAHCDTCHVSIAPDLHVDIPADIDAGTGTYVVPGDPDASKLWQVLLFAPGVPGMPATGQLDEASIAPVEAWILAGAPVE